ncbi:MAG: hypothetical protein Q7J65_01205, partial [Candidatus Marinimicrobia bacterium]|nr:hypothetical protein [Candidatus Neomarinimicrobiota bacterium]
MESGINKLLLFILIGRWLFAQVVFSDSFEDISIWNMIHSEDVEITLTTEQDVENRTLLRLDYNFKSGAGYCGIGRKAIIDYPENYRFRFGLQGTGSSNNLEFKLIDETGENVWWKIVRNLSLPAERKEFVARKREIEFAWGPIHDHTLWRSTEIQLIISSAEGGSGTLWIDNLVLESYQTLPINKIQPIVKLNGKEENNHGFFDQKRESCRKKMFSRSEKVEIDLCGNVELGGMVIYWDPVCVDGIYQLRFSENGENWTPTLSDGIDQTGVSWIRLTDMDTRYIQLELKKPRVSARMGIQEIEYIAPEKAADMNSWLKNRVERAKYGDYPRYMFNQASYWTVIGNVDDDREVLMNTDGQVETGNRGFLLEPVVIMNSKIVTWADVVTEQTLEGQYLPIPTVIWHHPEFMMEETALISGNPGESQLFIRYVFTPQKVSTSKCQMAVVGRPFQVNPDYQSLGYPGGFVPVYSIESNGNILNVNETRRIDLMQGADCIRLFDNHDGIGLSEIL